MKRKRVTIVIPTYNRPESLRQAIDSGLRQTEKCEVLVVDHGSTKETAEVALSFGDAISYIKREFDMGPIFAWLDGVVNSKSEYVKLLFDDDTLDDSYVQDLMGLMRPDVGFVSSNANVVDSQSQEILERSIFSFPKTGVYRTSSFTGERVAHMMISPSALILRRDDILSGLHLSRLPLQTSSYFGAGPDHFIKLQAMIRYHRFAVVNQPLVTFGHHPGSITAQSQQDPTKREGLKAVYDETWSFYQHLRLLKFLRPFTTRYLQIALLLGKWMAAMQSRLRKYY
jgi:glycosyltransferase involved in cell wall biosynthesis